MAFYADSLGVQSQDWLATRVPRLYKHSWGGTALCDWLPHLQSDLAREHPAQVVLAFAGNNLTPCMRPGGAVLSGSTLASKYSRDARTAISTIRATGAQVVLVRAPVGDARWQRLGMVGSRPFINAWSLQPGAWTLDGGRYVAPHQTFTWRVGGNVVRVPDGLHLTPVGAALYAKAIADGLERIS